MGSISHIISQLRKISLQDLTAVEFDSRVDTKFIFHKDKLSSFLEKIKDDLVILEVGNQSVFNYENLYFDSNGFEFYRKHHAGFGNRSKVRVRKYGEQGPYFFEVKDKTNKGKTTKHRISLTEFDRFETNETKELIQNKVSQNFDQLSNRTNIKYKRITLSNSSLTEKMTLDFEMISRSKDNSFSFDNLVIAEVKQINYSSRSPFLRALKELKIYDTSFSKYCSSVALMNHTIKKNRFKKGLTTVINIAHA